MLNSRATRDFSQFSVHFPVLKTVKPCGNCSNSTVPNYSEHCFKLCFDLSTFAEKFTMSTQLFSLITINRTDNFKQASRFCWHLGGHIVHAAENPTVI